MNEMMKIAYARGQYQALAELGLEKDAGFREWLVTKGRGIADAAEKSLLGSSLKGGIKNLNIEERKILLDNINARKFLNPDPIIPPAPTGIEGLVKNNPVASLLGAGALGVGGTYLATRPEKSLLDRINLSLF